MLFGTLTPHIVAPAHTTWRGLPRLAQCCDDGAHQRLRKSNRSARTFMKLREAAVIRRRGQPGRLAKRRGERAGLAEADHQSDIGYRRRRLGQ
jgi:hypothetical protein